jgi:hypothetical protein
MRTRRKLNTKTRKPQKSSDNHSARALATTPAADRCRRRFLRFFPHGFFDDTYLEWERNYKVDAHDQWDAELGRRVFGHLLDTHQFTEIAARALRIESRTNLLFSFEKMALRDAVRTHAGAREMARGLYVLLYGQGQLDRRFRRWCAVVASLPRRQTRVLTWPVVTVFGFLAQPDRHIFLKPNVTRVAAAQYGLDFAYKSTPNWETYKNLLELAGRVRRDLRNLRPRDMIDVQSFLWVQGSEEYQGRAFKPAQTTSIRRARRPVSRDAEAVSMR